MSSPKGAIALAAVVKRAIETAAAVTEAAATATETAATATEAALAVTPLRETGAATAASTLNQTVTRLKIGKNNS